MRHRRKDRRGQQRALANDVTEAWPFYGHLKIWNLLKSSQVTKVQSSGKSIHFLAKNPQESLFNFKGFDTWHDPNDPGFVECLFPVHCCNRIVVGFSSFAGPRSGWLRSLRRMCLPWRHQSFEDGTRNDWRVSRLSINWLRFGIVFLFRWIIYDTSIPWLHCPCKGNESQQSMWPLFKRLVTSGFMCCLSSTHWG